MTERAREVVVLAQDAARDLRDRQIDTEHLLLGLIGEGDGLAARALGAAGIDSETAYETVAPEPSRRGAGGVGCGHFPRLEPRRGTGPG